MLGNITNSYTYDAVGNRISSIEDGVATTYTYDMNDRLQTAGSESFTYDANGNTLTIATSATLTTHTYDFLNRLTRMVKQENGVQVDDIRYTYDTEGLRVARNDDGIQTKYLVDKNRDYAQVLAELTTTNTTNVSYVYGDDLIKQRRAANDSYYLYDGLGSTRALTDGTGAITDTYDYAAYGTEIDATGSTVNSYRFTGEQLDTNLNNYYLRARYYDPARGRFTTMDTFQGFENDPVTLHKYLYANADPVNAVDPSGKFSLIEFGVVNNIRSILSEITVEVGFSLLDRAFSDGGNNDSTITNTALAVGASIIAIGGGVKLYNVLSKKKKLTNAGKLQRGSIKLNAGVLRRAVASESYRTQQNSISIPKIERFVEDMINGAKFPPIKVDGDIIVEGHHRYIAAKIANKPIDVIPGTRPLFKQGEPSKPLSDIIFDATDYD